MSVSFGSVPCIEIGQTSVAKYTVRRRNPPRRERPDHVVVLGERHLRHVLLSYMGYYNETRTHLSLNWP